MSHVITATVLDQQMPTDETRQAGAVLQAIVSGHWTAGANWLSVLHRTRVL